MGRRKAVLKGLLREFKLKVDVFIGGNGKVVGNREENRIVDWKWGNCETDDMKLEVKISRRKGRGRFEASAHRLSLGLVRKAPRASLRAEV